MVLKDTNTLHASKAAAPCVGTKTILIVASTIEPVEKLLAKKVSKNP